jgi:uncharacterized protein YpmS
MRSHVLISLAALILAAQFCCCCGNIGGPEPPYVITPSDDAVQRFKERWTTAIDSSLDGSFTITVTEEEMTSLIVQQLAKQEDPPSISNLQVHLRDGRIEVYATATVNDSLPVPGMVAFSATATDGNIDVTVEEVEFGPLPMPDSIVETATDMLNDLIHRSMLAEMGEVTITDIQISEGEMTLTGGISPPSP